MDGSELAVARATRARTGRSSRRTTGSRRPARRRGLSPSDDGRRTKRAEKPDLFGAHRPKPDRVRTFRLELQVGEALRAGRGGKLPREARASICPEKVTLPLPSTRCRTWRRFRDRRRLRASPPLPPPGRDRDVWAPEPPRARHGSARSDLGLTALNRRLGGARRSARPRPRRSRSCRARGCAADRRGARRGGEAAALRARGLVRGRAAFTAGCGLSAVAAAMVPGRSSHGRTPAGGGRRSRALGAQKAATS